MSSETMDADGTSLAGQPLVSHRSSFITRPMASPWIGAGRRFTRSASGLAGAVVLLAGAVAATIALVVGLALGMLAAYYGGRADALIMRAMDVLLAFPYLLLAIAVVAILGPGLLNAMIAIAIVHVPHYARIVRGSVLS